MEAGPAGGRAAALFALCAAAYRRAGASTRRPLLGGLYVDTTGVADLHAELQTKEYSHLNPGLDTDEIGTHVSVLDPFGNTLRFNQRPAS